jgi:hypothetical protein
MLKELANGEYVLRADLHCTENLKLLASIST